MVERSAVARSSASDRPAGWPDRLACYCLAVLLLEVSITGSGQLLRLGPITLRNLLIAAVFLLTLPAVFANLGALLNNWQVRITALFGVHLFGCAVHGVVAGNPLPAVAADLTILLALILVPASLVLIRSRVQLEWLAAAFLMGSAILAALTLMVHFLGAFGLIDSLGLAHFASRYQLGTVSNVGDFVIRLYLRSHVLIVLSLPLAIHALATKRRPRLMLVIATVMAFALLASMTRSLLLGAALSCLLALGLRRVTALTLRAALLVVLGVAVLVGLSTVAYQRPVLLEALGLRMAATVQPGPDQSSSGAPQASPDPGGGPGGAEPSPGADDTSGEQASQDLRDRTWAAQWALFTERPVLGWGLGKGIPEVRSDYRTEFMYLDQGVKTGVVGVALLLATFLATPLLQVIASLRRRARWRELPVPVAVQAIGTCALLSFAASSVLNPFMNNTLGVSVLLLTLAASSLIPPESPGRTMTGSPGAKDAHA